MTKHKSKYLSGQCSRQGKLILTPPKPEEYLPAAMVAERQDPVRRKQALEAMKRRAARRKET